MKRRRGGWTLAELLVVIAVSSIVMGIATVSLQGMYRAQNRVSEGRVHRAATARFALQLRSDAHRAEQVVAAVGESERGVDFLLPGGETVQYRASQAGIVRVLTRESRILHRERYRISPQAVVKWQVDGPQTRMVSARIESADPLARDAIGMAPLTVQAAVGVVNEPSGRENRFARTPTVSIRPIFFTIQANWMASVDQGETVELLNRLNRQVAFVLRRQSSS
jgi:prepilin-type N-terminal cleavage/methylation domain-containing protein